MNNAAAAAALAALPFPSSPSASFALLLRRLFNYVIRHLFAYIARYIYIVYKSI